MKVIGLVVALVTATSALEWWQSASFYQVYPRSYKDSDGDGVGDINGITSNLDHLKELGIECIWLSPILESPQVDFGYDISNFREIDPLFGTMEDFDALLNRTKELDIKILMDFVPNHTSDLHEWFIKSENGTEGFEDYYMWVSGKNCKEEPWDPEAGVPCDYPNNWVSVFHGRAWEWSWKRKQFYLHQFHKRQPDLNYRNPKVVKEMKDVLTFWLEKGVDGFRIDAVNFLFEVDDLRDEEETGFTDDPESWDFVYHRYTLDQNETYGEVYAWRALIDEFSSSHGGHPRILMTETYADISLVMKYYQSEDGTQLGSHFPFNFWLITDVGADSTADDFKRVIMQWMDHMPEGATANWVLGNHDQKRFGTRFGAARIVPMHTIALTLPGVSVTYYGDEIGMVNHQGITWEETQDPQACNGPKERFMELSRDPARTPFQWSPGKYAGFSEGTKKEPWLPVHPGYETNNLEMQRRSDCSVYNQVRQLIKLRKEPAFAEGDFHLTTLSTHLFAYTRSHNQVTYAVVANVGENVEKVAFDRLGVEIPSADEYETEIEVRWAGVNGLYKTGDKVPISNVDVPGHDTLIFMYKFNKVSSAEKLIGSIMAVLVAASVLVFRN